MKLMKHITIALVLSAIPAMAFGQVGAIDAAMVDILCPDDECHTATYFQGSGGFVGMATADDEGTEMVDESEVAFIVSCGNVTTRAVAEKDDMGVVRQVFTEENGLACAAGGKIDIHRLMPGGWYWINDDVNSAVASLMPKTVLGNLGNSRVAPLDPGGLTVSAGDNATYVKHEMTGRVGILQHIVPTPPVELCGGTVRNQCVLHASYSIKLTADSAAVGASIMRDSGDAPEVISVVASLDGSGFLTTGTPSEVFTSTQNTVYGVSGEGGTVMIDPQDEAAERCGADNIDRGTPIMIEFNLAADGGAIGYVPGPGALKRTLSVMCPPVPEPSSQSGVELVPENPFPVE